MSRIIVFLATGFDMTFSFSRVSFTHWDIWWYDFVLPCITGFMRSFSSWAWRWLYFHIFAISFWIYDSPATILTTGHFIPWWLSLYTLMPCLQDTASSTIVTHFPDHIPMYFRCPSPSFTLLAGASYSFLVEFLFPHAEALRSFIPSHISALSSITTRSLHAAFSYYYVFCRFKVCLSFISFSAAWYVAIVFFLCFCIFSLSIAPGFLRFSFSIYDFWYFHDDDITIYFLSYVDICISLHIAFIFAYYHYFHFLIFLPDGFLFITLFTTLKRPFLIFISS